MQIYRKLFFAFTGASALYAQTVLAEEYVVKMRSQGADAMHTSGTMAFEPDFVSAKVGDTVRFVPTDFGHNAAPIAGMIPAGLDLPDGVIDQEYVLTLTKPGLYGIKCVPHFGLGMVALIRAGQGKAPNAAAAAAAVTKLPPLAGKRMRLLLASA